MSRSSRVAGLLGASLIGIMVWPDRLDQVAETYNRELGRQLGVPDAPASR